MRQLYVLYRKVLPLPVLLFLCFSSTANVYTVTNTSSTGAGSLQQAIIDANAHIGRDTIKFSITGSGPHTIIAPQGASHGTGTEGQEHYQESFKPITDPLFINGYSQSGAVQGTIATRVIKIVLSGQSLTTFTEGLLIASNDVEIAGLCIQKWPEFGNGIRMNYPFNNAFIWGNYIGTAVDGLTAASNGRFGINICEEYPIGASNLVIGTNGDNVNDANEGNLISGNRWDAVYFRGVRYSKVAGNIMNFNKNGTGVIRHSDSRAGVALSYFSKFNTIGTNGDGISDALEKNLIGNMYMGIRINMRADSNVIAGNNIGLDVNETKATDATVTDGIGIFGSSVNRIGTNADGVSDALERNVISNSWGYGIHIVNGEDRWIYVGATVNPLASIFNSNENVIAGNYIGVKSNGQSASDNGNGSGGIGLKIWSGRFTTGNRIGSNNDGVRDNIEGNVIAYNSGRGVTMYMANCEQCADIQNPNTATENITGTQISRNSFYDNGMAAIGALSTTINGSEGQTDKVNPNDNGDADNGFNNKLNFPVIETIVADNTNYRVTGFAPANTFIEFYNSDGNTYPNPFPSGYTRGFGQGKTFYFRAREGATYNGITDILNTTGTYTATQEGTGTGGTRTENKFSFLVPIATMPGISRLTALAMDASGNTSEFGGVVSNIALPVNILAFRGWLNNDKVNLNWVTAGEVRNSFFEVERSADGTNFTSIGLVSASGASKGDYYFTDENPLPDRGFYRLKQFDMDGKSNYTKVLLIKRSPVKSSLKLTPNPFVNTLTMNFTLTKAQKIQVRITDQLGRVNKIVNIDGNKGSNFVHINQLGGLPAGHYIVEVMGDNFSAREKLVKTK